MGLISEGGRKQVDVYPMLDGPSSFGALAANVAGEGDVGVEVDENNSVVVFVKEGRDVEMEGEKAKTFMLVELEPVLPLE
mmetsp:Transcript_13561/g.20393  ORF Transcript_13561/g.20393 Transcript_13561/m.20393 type:complete len:80 (-) Transcript_13561:94-333(-)